MQFSRRQEHRVRRLHVRSPPFEAYRENTARIRYSTDMSGPEELREMAETIRSARGYRWVGIYEVTDQEIAALAWTGTQPPAHPRFPLTQGLCGAAAASRAPVVVGDVRSDRHYLTTFGTTLSEIIVPVVNAAGQVVALIDVESDRLNAFQEEDRRFLEEWSGRILGNRT